MPAIRTSCLPELPDSTSSGGVAEIRQLITFPAGQLAHVLVPPDKVSLPASVDPSSEWFYIMAGTGSLWCGVDDRTIDLFPGRCVHIPAGNSFQYCSDDTFLEFILAAMPEWHSDYHVVLARGKWTPSVASPTGDIQTPSSAVNPIEVFDQASEVNEMAPDGSEIRLLGSEAAGGLAHCLLPPQTVTTAVRHRTVEEIWFVLSGHGELCRWVDLGRKHVVKLRAGVAADIATGVSFQFRTTGFDSLQLLLLTMPRWPGSDEAEFVDRAQQAWTPS